MAIKKFINKYRKQLLIANINRKDFPDFKKSDKVRKRLHFSGRVQGVGFRVEALGVANRLGLTGYVKNKANGDVEIEVQGPIDKIQYLINYLSSIRRAPIKNLDSVDIEIIEKESEFKITY
ncbi:MAG: acylphosphatase [Erysipelothrix sp.]|nr:acylphosphatase [Erysipelothrix sp.]